jgi:hypothetical protein
MTVGLQCFDGNGNLVLDATHHVGKVLAVVGITAGVSGSWSSDALIANGYTPFFAFQRSQTFGSYSGELGQWYCQQPMITMNGNTVTWTYGSLSANYSIYVGGILVIGMY